MRVYSWCIHGLNEFEKVNPRGEDDTFPDHMPYVIWELPEQIKLLEAPGYNKTDRLWEWFGWMCHLDLSRGMEAGLGWRRCNSDASAGQGGGSSVDNHMNELRSSLEKRNGPGYYT